MRSSNGAMELRIEKLVYGGDGLSRVEGRAALTPFVLPGELVLAETSESKPGLLRTRLARIMEPSPDRVDPPCPYFYRCGGCHYQHANYEAQLSAKRSILSETLRRIGKISPPEQIEMVSAEPWGYRNRTQLHIFGGRIGYLESRSHRLCPIDRCPISSPQINRAIQSLLEMIHDRRWPGFVRSLEIFTNETQTQINVVESPKPVARRFFEWCAERIPGAGLTALDYEASGFSYRVGNRSFFQVNRFLVDRLVEEALWQADGDTALDLFAGVGLFSLPLARRFRAVTTVESGSGAVRDMRFNAGRAGLPVHPVEQPVDAYLENLATAPDFVLADPPRAGLNKAALERLLALSPPRLTIVACDPATLARDLARLLQSGYELLRLTLVDLFPQTYHIESVAHLRRSMSSAM